MPEITMEDLEGANAVSRAGAGLCQHNLYFQAGDIWVASGQDRVGYNFPIHKNVAYLDSQSR